MKKIEIKIIHSHLRIYINGLMNISIHVDKISGIYSYKIGNENFCIDYFTSDGILETNYTQEKIWIEILKGLEKITLI